MESIFEQSSSFLVRIDFIHTTTRVTISRHRQTPDCRPDRARMAKLADAADLKSADLYRSWGFKSPSGHQHNSVFAGGASAIRQLAVLRAARAGFRCMGHAQKAPPFGFLKRDHNIGDLMHQLVRRRE